MFLNEDMYQPLDRTHVLLARMQLYVKKYLIKTYIKSKIYNISGGN